jgi:hypothetical protein
MPHGAFFGVMCVPTCLVFIGPDAMDVELIEISSDTAHSVASGAGSWSLG